MPSARSKTEGAWLSRAASLRLVIAGGAVLGGLVGARILSEGFKADPAWAMGGGMALAGVALCAWGMWRRRRWALWLSRALAVAAFGLGCLASYFSWDFFLWTRPTLQQRMQAVLRPDVFLLLAVPLLWLLWSFRSDIRSQFR